MRAFFLAVLIHIILRRQVGPSVGGELLPSGFYPRLTHSEMKKALKTAFIDSSGLTDCSGNVSFSVTRSHGFNPQAVLMKLLHLTVFTAHSTRPRGSSPEIMVFVQT